MTNNCSLASQERVKKDEMEMRNKTVKLRTIVVSDCSFKSDGS